MAHGADLFSALNGCAAVTPSILEGMIPSRNWPDGTLGAKEC